MVKGISRQVIVVQAPEEKLFEQAIFILREDITKQGGVTEAALLQEAKKLIRCGTKGKRMVWGQLFWSGIGAGLMGILWLVLEWV